MAVKVGINGFGAIGRRVLRAGLKRPAFDVVAINGRSEPKTLAHLLQYDSNYGMLHERVQATDRAIVIGDREIQVFHAAEPGSIPWAESGADVVLECTGAFRDAESVSGHLRAGAAKVIISAPAKGDDATLVMGVNEQSYRPQEQHIISNASCTTNCVAPVMKVLHERYGIAQAMITTIHSYTGDQRLLDASHKDLRRARAAALNIVPTSTGVSKAMARVIPEIAPRLSGMAFRVPTPVVSVIDVTAVTERPAASADEVNEAFRRAAAGQLAGIVDVIDVPLVSSDLRGMPFSAVVDGLLTTVANGFVKVVAWYDNEWAYAERMVDLALFVGAQLPS